MSQLSFTEQEIQSLFGHEAAEDEDPNRLRSYYFKGAIYEQVATDLPLRVLVGHKGIGKSALFQVAMAEDHEKSKLAILIKPDDVADLGLDAVDFLRLVRSWKVGLLEIVASKVLKSFGAGGVDVADKLKQFGGNVLDFMKSAFKGTAGFSLNASDSPLVKAFLKSSEVVVYIDDLDRGWEGRRHDVTRISALLNAARDLVNEHRGLKFRISLRSDVYYLVRTSDESTDKIEGSVIWHSWTNHEIFVLLVKRIETYFARPIDEVKLLRTSQPALAHYLDPVMESRFAGSGLWNNAPMYRVLMSLIRRRPRDLVKLCTLAARKAREDGNRKIVTSNFRDIFNEYSQGRVQDTINEYRSELPDIERLLFGMKPNKREKVTKEQYVYTTAALLQKIDNIRQGGEFKFVSGKPAGRKELAAFLYKINFLTARKESSAGIVRAYFEESRYLSNELVDFGFDWEVHPAYRWALQPDSIHDIFQTLALQTDDSK